MMNAELRGGARTILILQRCFVSKEYYRIELIDFLKIRGSGGMLPRKFFKFSIDETISGGF